MLLSRSTPIFVALATVGVLAPGAPALGATGDRAATLERELGPGVRAAEHRATGRVRFVGTAPGRPIPRPGGLSASASPSTVARAFLARRGEAFGIRDEARELRVTASRNSAGGRSAVRFQQLHADVPVVAGELVVNLDSDRNVLSASGEVLPAPALSTRASVGSGAARDAAIAAVAKKHRVTAPRLDAGIPSLWIYDAGLLGGPGPERPVLVWRLDVKGASGLPIDELVLVDAQRGSVALTIDQIENAKNRSVCDASNTPTQVPCTAPVRTEGGAPVASPTDVDSAYNFAGNTYDFFFGRFGRDSLDGQGLPLKSTVRYCDPAEPCPYGNAFWNGQQMVYGAGFAGADDVVGHELTHGVTDFSAHLFYYYQSGAINESLSDVFGEFVDLTNGAGNDTAAVRWKLGEDVPGGAIRDMANPPAFGDPDRTGSPNYTSDINEVDAGGVHQNSGVNNKAAFLMTDGGTFNGRFVTGIGIDKASRIYYTAQTTMLTSASDYADLASALQQACANLVGTSGITAADCGEVTNAVAAVQMSDVPPSAPAPEAPVCASGLVPTDLFSDDLENTASGNWAAQSGWFYPQNPNRYSGYDATYATSGTTNLWGDDQGGRGDYSIAMTRSVAIPANSTAHLRFNHAYGFDDDASGAYDGGVLEVSTNGGPFTDAGSLLTDNGYNGPITARSRNPASTSPLTGRQAFVRESNGYRSTRATLSSLGGQSVRFRFRIGTDLTVGDYGWFVDDVRIYTCAPPPSPPPQNNGGGTTTGGETTTGAGGTTSGGGTGSVLAPPSLESVRVRSCRSTGRGRRARVRCALSGFGAVRRASVKVTRRGRTAASGSVRPSSTGAVVIKPRRSLRRGSYRVTIKLTDARGATRTLTSRLRVR